MAFTIGPGQWISDQPLTFSVATGQPSRLRPPQAIDLDAESPLPYGWEKGFDLTTGVIYFKDTKTGIKTSKDPRLLSTQSQNDVYTEPWRGLKRALEIAGPEDTRAKLQQCREFETSLIAEKVAKWNQKRGPEKLPPLLPARLNADLPSLELSLRLETPSAQHSWSRHPPPSGSLSERTGHVKLEQIDQRHATLGERCGPVKLEQIDQRHVSLNERAGHVKLEQIDQRHVNFLGPNHNMGPFPSNSVKVKEEAATSRCVGWGDEKHGVFNLSSNFFSKPMSNWREGTETSASSAPDQPEFRNLLDPKGAMGPFSSSNREAQLYSNLLGDRGELMPSSKDQSAGACTLDKVLEALERTRSYHGTAVKNSASMKGGNLNSNSLFPSNASMKSKISSSPLLLPPLHPLQPPSSTRVSSAAASLSPTSSDASSAVSCKSSLHSSTSPSVMSFQGEELDDLGGPGFTRESKARSNVLPSATFVDPKMEDGQAPVTLVAVGCMSCHMFVMQSKDDTSCKRCGNTNLLDIAVPPRKRQRSEMSPS